MVYGVYSFTLTIGLCNKLHQPCHHCVSTTTYLVYFLLLYNLVSFFFRLFGKKWLFEIYLQFCKLWAPFHGYHWQKVRAIVFTTERFSLPLLISESYQLVFFSFSSMTGSDSSSTNYPGKIPSALDLPADIAERSHEKEDADTNSVDR